MDFEIHLRSLRGHRGVKGQIYKDAPIELKFQYNDPYDILSILKYFLIHSRLSRGHKVVKVLWVPGVKNMSLIYF